MARQEQNRLGRIPPAEDFRAKCRGYFDACDQEGRRYTRPGLLVALDLSERRAEGLLHSKGSKYSEQAEILRKGLLRIIDALEQREDSKSLFLLKQPCYGGYREKPEESGGGGTLDVKISFQGGEEFGR